MITPALVERPDGRTLRAYDVPVDDERLTVFWHHGTPNVGTPPEPLLPASAERGIRWVSYDRPGYGGSTPHPGRDVASAAGDVAAIADALRIERFAVLGHSGGGPHALACAALLPDRVVAAVSGSAQAPFGADGLDWFAGINRSGTAELRAAVAGRAALERVLAASEFDPEMFTPADHAALAGAWGWLGRIAGEAAAAGIGGMVDDDLAYVAPWGFDPADVVAPVLLVHGDADRVVPPAHGRWLADRIGSAELWLRPGEGHVSVLGAATDALDWLLRT
ncbi:alpha/beta fold hydrolase [Cellulomonas fengjieae]|uniref:Alpha/beta fold hydrolase n=1 Tax=Cellulomonas fengjieae TaxID=2819978 RepID=A0ABS3SKZ3_9CELL|nr:alpha/beta fold hydrolase [Cellulomonas fengjieae]MBO3086044.1 alpha/beta fold hydrolase [Cellulomonas fengjieae]QVI65887.1 alpha/beta fold hydrolase [Cellulomonas fengjieae]